MQEDKKLKIKVYKEEEAEIGGRRNAKRSQRKRKRKQHEERKTELKVD